MKILEEFWYGNIDPAEYDSNASKEMPVRNTKKRFA